MKKPIILLFLLFICLLQSCYTTSAYRTVGGNYFQNYSKEKTYYAQRMESFRQAHPELMLDSSLVNKHFKKGFYLSVPERKRMFSENLEYPLFPHINYYGLNSWFIKSPDKIHVYEIGLFNCSFDKPKYNLCTLELYNVFNLKDDGVKWVDLTNKDTKEYKERRKEFLKKFEAEILPLLQPYFPIK